MRLLLVSTQPHPPLFYGGSESSSHDLARSAHRFGHHAAVLSSLVAGANWNAMRYRVQAKLSAFKMSIDEVMDYPVYRTWDPIVHLARVAEREQPDAVIVQAGGQRELAAAAVALGIRTVVYLRHTAFGTSRLDPAVADRIGFIANSRHTAQVFETRTGRTAAVIPPLVDPDAYRTEQPGTNVLFVNPRREKGMDLVFAIAECCPDIPFLFVDCWGKLRGEELGWARERASRLKNVTWIRSTPHMRSVYARARIVIAPSGTPFRGQPVDYTEAWGRVATEAQVSGIPVIATADGGFPESVGDGGILVDRHRPVDEWVAALRRLWDDDVEYLRCSRAARARSLREDMTPASLLRRVIEVCQPVP